MPLPDEGSSLASLGSGEGADRFFADSTPTLGSPNEVASFETFGFGCVAGAAIPKIGIAAGDLPWLAESFTLTFSSLPLPPAAPYGILGFSDSVFGPVQLPQDLGFVGFPGCTQWVSLDFCSPLVNQGGSATWTIPVPANVPTLVGAEFFAQGVVLFGVGDAAVSDAARAVFGGQR